jgi:2-methylcitrate dehydratase PrpD
MPSSLTQVLARYAATSSIERIPDAVKERAKQVILDEMACAQFGRRSLAGDLAARYALSLGGAEESLILGTRTRVSAQYAAFANGAAGHGEEVDGAHVVGGHPGATLVHAAVAVAERQRATGAELLNAVVLAYDVGTRLVEACGGKLPFKARMHLYSDFLYAVGATVAAGRLLGLDPVRHCHAMALVTFQTNSLASLYQEKRHISKSVCNGQFALAGVSAALMSAMGMEGVEDVLGMQDGLLDAWGVKDGANEGVHGGAQAVTRELGEDFAIMRANFKFLNAGYPIHAAVEAATELLAEHHITAASIASVQVGMPENAMRIVDNRDMHNICMQDMLGATLVRGRLSLRESPFPALLGDPTFTRLRAHIAVAVDAELNREQPNGRGSRVTIHLINGERVSRRLDAPRGHALRGGVSWADLHTKWRDGLPDCDTDKMISLAQRLEDVEDVRVLASAFTQPLPP